MGSPLQHRQILALAAAAAVGTAAPAQGPITPPAGMTGFWAFDGDLEDFGPSGLHAAFAGAGGAFVAGHVAQALRANAPDGRAMVADGPDVDLRTNFTFEGWIRIDQLPAGTSYILNKGSTAHRSTPYAFGLIGSSGQLPTTSGSTRVGTPGAGRLFAITSDNVLENTLIANQAVPTGVFVHVAMTVTQVNASQHQTRIFLNGAQVGVAWISRLPFDGNQPLQFGAVAGSEPFGGLLDELTMYERALTAAELQDIHGAGPQGKEKPNRDTMPPLVTIDAPQDGAVVGDRMLPVTATVIDDSATTVDSTPAGLAAQLPAGGGQVAGTVTLDAADGPQVVTVNAVDSGALSGAHSVTVMLDTTPPQVSVLTPAAGTVFSSGQVTIAVAVDDLTAVELDVGGQPQSMPAGQGSVAVTLPLAEGVHDVPITAVDRAGHRTVLTHRLIVDLTAPMVAFDTPADGTLYGAASDYAPVVVRVDDLTETEVQSQPAGLSGMLPAGGGLRSGVVPLSEGINQLMVTATDRGGRSAVAIVSVNRDSTAPQLELLAPDDGTWLAGMHEVRAAATDIAPGSGIDRIELYVDDQLLHGSADGQFVFDLDSATLAEGAHTIAVVAVDGAGNRQRVQRMIQVDNTAPIVQILTPTAAQALQGTASFQVLATDGGSGVVAIEQIVGGRAPTNDASVQLPAPVASWQINGSEDTTQWPNEVLLFAAMATDQAGNVAQVEVEAEVANPQSAEALLRPGNGARVQGRFPIRVDARQRNVQQATVYVDGAPVASRHHLPLRVHYDSREHLDGPLQLRAVVRMQGSAVSETVHNVRVDNMHVVGVAPQRLQLHGRQSRQPLCVMLAAPNLHLLEPCHQHRLELAVPGGGTVAAMRVERLGGRGRLPVMMIAFDRGAVVQAMQAAAAQTAGQHGHVRVRLLADGRELDTFRLGFGGRCGR